MRDEDLREVRDPLPEAFASLDEAGAFWDTHSSADYEDEMEDVDVEVDLSATKFYCRIDKQLVRRLLERARREGLSTEELIDRWLRERVATA